MSFVLQCLETQFRTHPTRTAIVDEDRSITYQSLQQDVLRLRAALGRASLEQGETIAVYIDDRYLAIASIIALLSEGLGYLPLDPVYPEDRRSYMLANSGCRLLLVDDVYQTDQPIAQLNVVTEELTAGETTRPAICTPNPGYLIYTSGSTGQPKGVELSLSVLDNLIQWQLAQEGTKTSLITGQFSALSFDVSFQEIFSTLCAGGTLVLISTPIKQDFERFNEFVIEQGIQRLFMPYIAVLNLAQWAVRTDRFPVELQRVITAGEALLVTEDIRRFFTVCRQARLSNQYGPSESHVVTNFDLPEQVDQWEDRPAIGFAIDTVDLGVVDDQLDGVEVGRAGELLIGGPVIADGYRNNPDQTAQRFIELESGSRYYRTGDRVVQDAEGCFWYRGRNDSQVKIHGYRVETEEVESALLALPAVNAVAVTVGNDDAGNSALIAFVVSGDDAPTPIQLRSALKDILPAYMIPAVFDFRSSLLKTPSGKIDRRAMVAQWQDVQVSKATAQNSSSEAILEIIRAQLSDDTIGLDENLFDAGLDSLGANQLSARFADQLSLKMPAFEFFQHRNVRSLLEALQQKPASVHRDTGRHQKTALRDIAVVGIALRTPGADNLEDFWALIDDGRESIHEFEPLRDNRVNARGIIHEPTGFDPRFFGISPVEAFMVDPQQRLLLELAWEALENGGFVPGNTEQRVGIYCGTGNNTYYLNQVLQNPEKVEEFGALQAMIANEKDYCATRIAHKLNLKGPAVNIQSACSTSLVAIGQAVQALRLGDCDMALAGAASISFPQQQPYQYEEGAIYSKDGHTRTFDAQSSGTVFSDGGALVLLKPMEQAVADHDRIYGVIRGVGLNNDGGDKGSFSAPSIDGQRRVIRSALDDAGVHASQIGYIEAHGTATPLGDPIEVAALTDVFSADSAATGACRLGSVKSNFGHLTAAAGVVGLIKTLRSIEQGMFLPLVNYTTPNPALNLEQSPFTIETRSTTWDQPQNQRMAGISSFGIGGTNAHVIVAGVTPSESQSADAPVSAFPLCLSARSPEALAAYVERYQQWFAEHPDAKVAQVTQEHFGAREAMPYRLAVFGDDTAHIQQQLSQVTVPRKPAPAERSIVFAFPGQGSQAPRMGQNLYQQNPGFRAAMDDCARSAQPHGMDLLALLFEEAEDIHQTQYTQLALFAVGYSLARALRAYGLEPDALIGHSIGELVAATLAGVFDLDTAVKVVITRGRCMQAQPAGSMASVRLDADELKAYLSENVTIAAINAPQTVAVAGPDAEIDALLTTLADNSVAARKLRTSHAFHSAMMQGAQTSFLEALKGTRLNRPDRPFISCVTGDWIGDEQATSLDYWAQQIRQPVQYAAAASTVCQLPNALVLELGPGSTATNLLTLVQMSDDDLSEKMVDTLTLMPTPAGEEQAAFMLSVGEAWAKGARVHPSYPLSWYHSFYPLPTYPFQRKPYEILPESVQAETTETLSAMPADTSDLHGAVNVKEQTITKLKTLLSETSGLDLSSETGDASFFELGFDSLFLTQCIAKIKKQFRVNLSFRDLMNDCNTLNKLTDRLLEEGYRPETVAAPEVAPNKPSVPVSAPSIPTATPSEAQRASQSLVSLFQQQMDVIHAQMTMLQQPGQTPAASAVTAAPAAATTAPQPTAEKRIKPFGAGTRIQTQRTNDLTAEQERQLGNLTERYCTRFAQSKAFAQNNRRQLADPRVVSGFRPMLKELIFPVVVNRSKGAYLWDIDGNQMIDVTCGFGSNYFGHGAPFIKEAVARQLDEGYEIGPQHPLVAEVSRKFCQVTGSERVAMCNTGSEAVLGAVRLARTVTAKEHVVMFENDYHGINDEVIVHRGGNGHSTPAAAGIPEAAVEKTMMLDYGSDESLAYIKAHADEIAAVLVEPVQSRKPSLQPREFLKQLRELCDAEDIALIFDEVITGFRLHPKGAQGYYDIQADIATYGKVIGGGMPVGVIAGKARFMDALDGGQWQFGDDSVPEVGVTYFAGTFVRHPLALAAANAVLDRLIADPDSQQRLTAMTESLAERINTYAREVGAPLTVAHCSSLFRFEIPQDIGYEELIYILLREKGIHIWDARPCFLTLAHTERDIDQIISAVKQSIDEMQAMTFFRRRQGQQTEAEKPPVPGARLGKDPQGNPAWYIEDPDHRGQYLMLDTTMESKL